MKITPKTYALAYLQAVAGEPVGKHKSIAQNFWQLVWRRGHFKWHKHILDSVKKLRREQAGVVLAKVATAQAMTEKEQHELMSKLAKATGKKIELEHAMKPHLLAGMIVTVNDERFDASLKGRLDALYSRLVGKQ